MIQLPGKNYLFALIIIAVIPTTIFLLLFLREEKPLEILIMNKNVSSPSRIENKTAFGIINQNRIVRSNKKTYNRKKDYYGFFPLRPRRSKEFHFREIDSDAVDSLANHYDMAWFIDTYSTSMDNWHGDSRNTDTSANHGGLTLSDYLFLEKMINRNKLVIAEFNFFASPTSETIREKTEELTGVYWSGWTGMYYDNLDFTINEYLPLRIVEAYRSQSGGNWSYTGSGIILAHENGSVLVLENETHLDIEVPLITTTAGKAKKYGVIEKVHYPYRFDISYTADTMDVISYYELSVNEKGERLLKSNNIPSRFPAVIGNPNQGNFFYHGGSFSNYDLPVLAGMLRSTRSLDFLFYNDNVESRSKFLWKYYNPFVSAVISNYYISLSESAGKAK